nr:hypothetical protein [Tanacetum cinerariifolium]
MIGSTTFGLSSVIFTAVASLFFWQWELSSLAVGTSSGSGNSITDSGNASWSWIHTPGRAKDVLSYFQLWEEGLSFRGTKLILIFVTAESPKEGVRRAIPEYGATKLQKESATSFPPNNDHLTLTFVSHTRNTPKTIKEKPSERPKLEKKPYLSPLPEQVSTPVVQQRAWSQKRSFGKQNLGTNYRGKRKSRNAKEPEQRKRVRSRTIIGMVRGDTSKKRSHEQSKQWTRNKISFPSMQRPEKFGSRGFHYPLSDKVFHRQWIATMVTKRETLQECWRMEEVRRSILERRTILPQMLTSEPEETTSKDTKGSRGQTGKIWNPEYHETVTHLVQEKYSEE